MNRGLHPLFTNKYQRRIHMPVPSELVKLIESESVLPNDIKILPNGAFMMNYGFGGGYDDDDGDVDQVQLLKNKIASLEKTIERLAKVYAVPGAKTVFVLKIPQGEGFSTEDHAEMIKRLPAGSMLIAMPDDYTLEGLDDKDLAECGLQRSNAALGLTDKEAYDYMLMGYRRK